MKHFLRTLLISSAALLPLSAALAKDKPLSLSSCPAPVQALVKTYSAQYTFESIAFDEKKRSGGTPVYEAKFTAADKKRFELHITPQGQLINTELKNPKN